jgi:predicted nucleotide-binding protein (sugar kinase/HSP70/actin superfamily)
MIFNEFGVRSLKNPLGKIGIPMALTSYTLFPLYAKFINELGYDVVISHPSKTGNTKTKAPICYPCELVHGAVNDLINRNVDYVFLPHVIELEIPAGYIHGYTCPSTTTIPDIIRAAFENSNQKILSPHISLSEDLIETTIKEFGRIALALGLEYSVGVNAGLVALSHYNMFREIYYEFGKKKLKDLLKKPSVIIAGRPYVVYPPEVNIALPRKIVSRGYNAIPSDLLPLLKNETLHTRNAWKFTQEIDNAIEYVKNYPNLYICFVSCFSCGPDSTMYHHFRQQLEGHAFCYLEIDSHTAHAGFETRVGAFLDIIEESHQKTEKNIKNILNPNITA